MAKQKRARRFSVPNQEQVLVSIGTEQLKGTLHLLSLTGGAVRLNKRFAPGTLGDIALNTVSGTFSAAIELLQMADAKAQAFRFIAMAPVARERLQDALKKMRGQGLAVDGGPLDKIRSLARQVLSGRSRK
jgi:PilZ domain-containing protein